MFKSCKLIIVFFLFQELSSAETFLVAFLPLVKTCVHPRVISRSQMKNRW